MDLETGELDFANAGHNPPLLKRADGTLEYLKGRTGFILAGMEGVGYRCNEVMLNPGDRLFLYTDGVTEATNENNELFGEQRLCDFISKNQDVDSKRLLPALKSTIDEFVGNAPQFDDITMLMLDYKPQKGEKLVKQKIFPAKVDALTDVISFAEETLEGLGCSMKNQMAICVAIEEVFVNVANYAYQGGEGNVGFAITFDQNTRVATFVVADRGVEFDPLKKPDPDITLSAEEREIGGLGIFITKKTMDAVSYEYKDVKNILTMIKKI